jgi:hypothetical protein
MDQAREDNDQAREDNDPAPEQQSDAAFVSIVTSAIDAEFYWRQASGEGAEPAGSEAAALHYLREGERLGLNPHPLFHPNYYLARNPGRGNSRDECLRALSNLWNGRRPVAAPACRQG